jgi:hypothetical protein
MCTNIIGNDIKCIIIRYTVGEPLYGPSVINNGKSWYPASVWIVGTYLVGLGASGIVLIGNVKGVLGKTASFRSILIGAVCCGKLLRLIWTSGERGK